MDDSASNAFVPQAPPKTGSEAAADTSIQDESLIILGRSGIAPVHIHGHAGEIQKLPRFPGNVGTHVPGIGPGKERHVGFSSLPVTNKPNIKQV